MAFCREPVKIVIEPVERRTGAEEGAAKKAESQAVAEDLPGKQGGRMRITFIAHEDETAQGADGQRAE